MDDDGPLHHLSLIHICGIIRITLRKRRENGLDGSLSMRTTQNARHHFYTPSGNINIHTGRLDLYASAWADLGLSLIHICMPSTSASVAMITLL